MPAATFQGPRAVDRKWYTLGMDAEPPPTSIHRSPTAKPPPGDGCPWWMAYLYVLGGVFMCCLATGVIPAPEESFRAPRWIIFVCGMVFFCFAGVLFKRHDPVAIQLFAMGIAGGLGTVSLWVGLYGEKGQFVLNRVDSVETGQLIFGIGGVICLTIAGLLMLQVFRSR